MSASAIRLFRVIAPVTNIEEAARFYSAIFENPGFRISPGRHYFDCGGVILAVYDAVADGDAQPVRHNAEHLYFAVPDLDAVFKRVEKAGGLSTASGDGNLPMGKSSSGRGVKCRFTCTTRLGTRSASSTSNRCIAADLLVPSVCISSIPFAVDSASTDSLESDPCLVR